MRHAGRWPREKALDDPRRFLTDLFDAAVASADPKAAIARHLPPRPAGRTVVVGAGKGAAQMAAALEELWDGPLSGVVVTRYGFGAECRRIRVLEAAHPVPDAAGLAASQALFEAVAGLGPDDLVIALVSGGGSALLACPGPGLALADEIALNEALLASGAPISVMNLIRRQASGIKGGRLALAAAPARVVTLVVSDVPGDDPAEVASGPTVPGAGGPDAALAAIARYRIDLPERVLAAIRAARPPRPDDPAFARNEVHVIASSGMALEAAAAAAEARGVAAVILTDSLEGEAAEAGRVLAAILREVALRDRPWRRPVVLLSGGETTVTLGSARGRGGRNTEFLLGLALAVEGVGGLHALAADTDGIDGTEDNAGAFCDSGTLARVRAAGADPAALLAEHRSHDAFALAGDLFVTGPTGTNVNDFRALLALPG